MGRFLIARKGKKKKRYCWKKKVCIQSRDSQVVDQTKRFSGNWAYPDVICDAADGDDHVSGQQVVFRHLLPQSHIAEGFHIAEHHLPLSPVESTVN